METKFDLWTVNYITNEGTHSFCELETLEEVREKLEVLKNIGQNMQNVTVFPNKSNITYEELKEIKDDLTLLDLTTNSLIEMQKSKEFEMSDFAHFGNIVEKVKSIDDKILKPYLITWHINEWEYIADYIIEALEFIGYEFIGNMDLSEGLYNFDTDDEIYDKLFRYKNTNCDYTNHLKFSEND